MTLRIKHYTRFQDIPLSRSDWNTLLSRNCTNTVFQTHEWMSTWWSAFESHNKLRFLIAYKNDTAVGFAPLMLSESQFGRISVRFVSDSNSDYCDFVTNENPLSFTQAIFDYLSDLTHEWSCIQFRNIPENSAHLAAMKSLAHRHSWHIYQSREIPTPKRKLPSTNNRPTNWQYSVRRPYNRLMKQGDVRFRHITDLHDAYTMLDILIEQHKARYHEKHMHSLFDKQNNIDFFKLLLPVMLESDYLDFSVLELDANPIALHFGFKYNGTLVWYKPCFDIRLSHLSPGTVLIKQLIEYAEKDRFELLDFTIGDESFKDRFCTSRGFNRNISIYQNPMHARITRTRERISDIRNRIRTRRASTCTKRP